MFLFFLRFAFLFFAFVLLLPGESMAAYTAVSDGYVKNGGRVRLLEPAREQIYADRISEISLDSFPGDGIFIVRDAGSSFDELGVSGFFPLRKAYSSDRAVAVCEEVSLPDSPGKYVFSHSAGFENGARAVIDWEYRLFPDGYSRLSRRINNGSGMGVYDGDPIKSAKLVSIFPLSFLSECGEHGAEISVRSSSASSVVPYEAVSSDGMLSESPDGLVMHPSSSGDCRFVWRATVYGESKDGKVVEYVESGAGEGERRFKWDGRTDLGFRAEPGRYTVAVEMMIRSEGGLVPMPVVKREVTLPVYPRLSVSESSGEILADSRFAGASAVEPKNRRKLVKGFAYRRVPAALGYSVNRIYMRKGPGSFLVRLEMPDKSGPASVAVSSDIRKSFGLPLAEKGGGVFEAALPVVESERSIPGALAVGPSLDGSKGYAFLDVTYPEDSEALSAILEARGWTCRGAVFPDDLTMPNKAAFLKDFIRSGGMERLSFSCGSLTVSFMMKNQSRLFYYSGHGWGDGSIFNGKEFFFPDSDMEPGDWNDGMEAAVFSSCSVFDIMNFHNRKFTELGRVNYSPGKYWEHSAGGRAALLGYNWCTFEGKPPNAFDTRVVRSFLASYLAGSSPVSAWFNANFANGDSECPCAIANRIYYYMSGGRICEYPGEKWRISDGSNGS